MSEKKKIKPPVGKFISDKSSEELKKAQKMRALYMLLSTLCFAVLLFIPQGWAEKAKAFVWLQSTYVLAVVAMIVVSVWTSVSSFKGCNLSGEITDKVKPPLGFEKRTFRSFEWFMYAHILYALLQIGLIIYGYDVGGLICTILGAASAALSVLSRNVSFDTLKNGLTYLPPKEQPSPSPSDEQIKAPADSKSPEDPAIPPVDTDNGDILSVRSLETSNTSDDSQDYVSPNE